MTDPAPDPESHPGTETGDRSEIETADNSPASDIAPGTDTLSGKGNRRQDGPERALGDFTTTPSILGLVPLAVVIGALGAGISLALLDMIGFFTNLFYFQRLSVHLVSPFGSKYSVNPLTGY